MLQNVSVEGLASGDPCAVATDRYHRIALWRQLFTALVFVLAVVLTVFIALAIIFAVDKQWAQTVATAIGGAATGKPLAWVLARRGESVTEEKEAFEAFTKACGAQDSAGKPQFITDLKFF